MKMKPVARIYTILIFIFLFAPIAILLFFSFNSSNSLSVFTGFSLHWYEELLRDANTLNALKNTLILALCASILSTIMGTAAAVGIQALRSRFVKSTLNAVTNIPMINPDIITGISLMLMFVFVGRLLGFGSYLNFGTMLIAHISFCLPYVILQVLPKLRQMDRALPEAAQDLGCTPVRAFFKVEVPEILPGILTGFLMAFTLSLDDFVISYFTSGTGFTTLPIAIYNMTKKTVTPKMYALATLIFFGILLLLIIRTLTGEDESSAVKKDSSKKASARKASGSTSGPARAKRISLKLRRISRTRRSGALKLGPIGGPAQAKRVSLKLRRAHHTRHSDSLKLGLIGGLVAAVCVLILILVLNTSKNTLELNVYNWGEYISDGSDDSMDVVTEFESWYEETYGQKVNVNYTTYASCEDMYAKLKSGAVSYDLVIPSDYMIARMKDEGMLLPLNYENIPNYQYIGEQYRGLYYDPDDMYSIPYTYGVVGVIYDANVVDEEDLDGWDLMWNPKYAGKILQFNNPRDAFGTAMYRLGIPVNTQDRDEWNKALDCLLEQRPIVKSYVMDEIYNTLESGEAAIGAYYAGDYFTMADAQAEGVDLQFYYPEQTNYFFDAMCIPSCCEHKDLAEIFINYMLSEEVAIANAEYIMYASPNSLVYENEDYIEEMGEEAMAVLYPPTDNFAERYNQVAFRNLPDEMLDYMNELWEELKIN